MTCKKLILITGPTASGKTALAIDVARRFDTSIISADSRQCFQEMSIGVAKPSPAQLAAVKHYFIDSHSIHDRVNAGVFETYALHAAAEIFTSRDVAVMAGGTGLYIKAFCDGLDEIPAVAPGIRERLLKEYEQKGIEWLRSETGRQDPVYYASGEIHNPHRLMRALEVKLSTGRSLRDFQQQKTTPRDFEVVKFAVDLPREQLYENINNRVEAMFHTGLEEEVRSLAPFRSLNALQTVGYLELFAFMDGALSLTQAAERIKINTRHYAKRQMTWFRKDPDINWIRNAEEIQI